MAHIDVENPSPEEFEIGDEISLKVSRTIADLAGGKAIFPEHISEAVQHRALNRLEWQKLFPLEC